MLEEFWRLWKFTSGILLALCLVAAIIDIITDKYTRWKYNKKHLQQCETCGTFYLKNKK